MELFKAKLKDEKPCNSNFNFAESLPNYLDVKKRGIKVTLPYLK